MEIDGLKVQYVGDYGKYKVYAPAENLIIGIVLYLECDGKIEICDPSTYDEVSKYLIEHYPQDYADEDDYEDEDEDEEDLQEDSSE